MTQPATLPPAQKVGPTDQDNFSMARTFEVNKMTPATLVKLLEQERIARAIAEQRNVQLMGEG